MTNLDFQGLRNGKKQAFLLGIFFLEDKDSVSSLFIIKRQWKF